MNPTLIAAGAFFTVEGAANLYYWRNDNHPWYFEAGRALRIIFGLAVIYMGAFT